MKLLTLNLGLFGLSLPGRRRIPFDRHISRRLAAAPGLLAMIDADVIALQEIYATADRRFLIHALRYRFAYHAVSPRSGSLLGNGLMFLSRYPLSDTAFLSCRGQDWTHWLWHQGFLCTTVDMPEHGKLRLMNVHLSAGAGLDDQEAGASLRSRNREISAMISIANAEPRADVLLGDFNTSPEIAPDNYRAIVASGFLDAYAQRHGIDGLPGYTWDASNPLNHHGRFRDSPSQRIDHIFFRTADCLNRHATIAQIVLDSIEIATPDGLTCLSDHYGMFVEIATNSGMPTHSVGEDGSTFRFPKRSDR